MARLKWFTFCCNFLTGSELHQAEGEGSEKIRLVVPRAEDQVPVVHQLVQHLENHHLSTVILLFYLGYNKIGFCSFSTSFFNVVNCFSSSLALKRYKLECLSTASIFLFSSTEKSLSARGILWYVIQWCSMVSLVQPTNLRL